MKLKFFILSLVFTAILYSFVLAQTAKTDIKTFDKDGLSFNYPTDWELTDNSTAELQQIKLTLSKTSAIVYVTSPRKPIVNEEQLRAARESITDQFIENIRLKFSQESNLATVKEEDNCSEKNREKPAGKIIHGSFQGQPSTAEVYAVFPEHRFVNLFFVRNDKDEKDTSAAWQTIIKTVKTLTPSAENLAVPSISGIASGAGILNGRAVSLPIPRYPNEARLVKASGRVKVEVTIDEYGKVISARAVLGHPALRTASENAAMRAKFSVTYFCGEAVKVTGIINYNFY